MEKVSMWAVAQKTWLLLRTRSGYFTGYALGALALHSLYYAMEFLSGRMDVAGNGPESGIVPTIVLMQVIHGAASMVLSFSLLHFSVASCRTRTSFFPKRPINACFQFLWVTFVLFLVAIIVTLPLSGVFAEGILAGPDKSISAVLLAIVAGLLGLFGVLVPLMRFGATFTAISIGDDWGFSKAWRMTKGHTGRLMLWAVLLFSPWIVVDFVWGGALGLIDWEAAFEPTIPFLAAGVLVNTVSHIFLTPFYAIAYEDFRKRYEAMHPDETFVLSEVGG